MNRILFILRRWTVLAPVAVQLVASVLVAAPPRVSPGNTAGRVGYTFGYNIGIVEANPPVQSYDARPLPRGLTVNASTGVITGVPQEAGTVAVTLSATNADGTGTATLNLTVEPPPSQPPVIANQSFVTSIEWASRSNTLGWVFAISATNAPTSYGVSGLPGARWSPNSTMVGMGGWDSENNVPAGVHSVTLSATNPAGTTTKTIEVRVHPSMVSYAAEKGNYRVGETIRVIAAFNGPVNVTGAPSIGVASGRATLQSGNGTAQLIFAYTLGPTDIGTRYFGNIELNGGAIAHVGSGLEARLYGPPPVTGFEPNRIVVIGPPLLMSPPTASGTVGTDFSYSITASNSPVNYGARGLPPGLTVNASTGVISGVPTTAGTFNVTLEATNTQVPEPGTQSVTMTIAPANAPPTSPPAPVAQTVTISAPPSVTVGQSATLGATASSGLPVTLELVSGAATLSGTALTATAPGPITIRGTQAGNSSYAAASASVTVNAVSATTTPPPATPPPTTTPPATTPPTTTPPPPTTPPPGTTPPPTAQAIEFVSPVSVPVMGQPFLLSATSSAGLPVTFSVVSGNATIDGNALIVSGPGAVVVRASQAGTSTIAPASAEVVITGAVRAAQSIAFAPPTALSTADEAVTLTASSSAGLPVTLSIVSGPARLEGSRLVLTGELGEVVVRAAQAGTETVEPVEVRRVIAVIATPSSRLLNVSARLHVSEGDSERSFITGFAIAGEVPQRVLIRAAGPALSNFGVQAPLPNPKLRLFDGAGRMLEENDDWSGADVGAQAIRVGAFGLGADSRDAALVKTLAPGAYSVHVLANGGAGVALAEIYDASETATGGRPPLVNLSTRGFVESGESQVAVGFVIGDGAPKRVLVRGIGPALVDFGIVRALVDPVVTLYRGSEVIARGDDWHSGQTTPTQSQPSGAGEIAAAMSAAGAFPLPAGSKDAALVVTLAPGAYTALVSGVAGATGVALVEVYELR